MHDMVLLLSERVMWWQLLIKEFSPKIKYVKGIKNVVADALSRGPRGNTRHETSNGTKNDFRSVRHQDHRSRAKKN
eukprot:2794145-Ditylum_brightwellii.AAC.1